jgi:hypothetical protein
MKSTRLASPDTCRRNTNALSKFRRHVLPFLLLLIPTPAFSAGPAEVSPPDDPLLFVKRHNYQGLHIYDTFYQWRPGGGIYVLENPAAPPNSTASGR